MAAFARRFLAGEATGGISWEIIQAIIIVVLGGLVIRLLAGFFTRSFLRGVRNQSRVATRKAITYVGVGLLVIIALDQLGVELTALLGAAGVIGIAVGIASQASLSNVISGLFLVSEKTFELGDVIRIGERTGVVHSIDPLSIKLRTFDNLLVRIPNQQIIDSELVNVTRFPIRRLDIKLTVPASQLAQPVGDLLKAVAKSIDLCLDEPEPLLVFNDIREGNLHLLFGVWFEKANFLAVKNTLYSEIQRRFKEEGISFGEPVIRLSQQGGPQRGEKGFLTS